MQKTEAAMILAGVTPEEQRQASAPTNLHVITGTIAGKSENGKTRVLIDGLVFSADNSQYIEIDTLGGLEEGDIATILLTGEAGHGMTPLAVGAAGSIDRIDVRIGRIEADYIKATVLDAEVARLGYLTANSAKIQELEVGKEFVDDLTANNIDVNRLVANSAFIKDLELDGITADKITAASGYIEDLTAKNITTTNIQAASGYIGSLVAQNISAADITADHGTIGRLDSTYATITNLNAANGRIDSLQSSKANVTDLTAATGRITSLEAADVNITGRLDVAEAVIDDLDANYIHTDMLNADVAWLQNGVIKDGAIVNGMIQSVSANKLTAGTIDASNINVTNLRADNLKVARINGQPVIGGYALVDPSSSGYSSKNPKTQGWYELSGSSYVATNDTSVVSGKNYYSTSDYAELYDQDAIDGMVDSLNNRIDAQIETWTTDAVPTLSNYPASSWTTSDLKAEHVGDICYVMNAGNDYDGYTYRFAYDNSTSSYKWVLIKDNQVTAALGRIIDLETFESETSTWIDETDEGLRTIRSNHTALSGRVDKVVKSSIQLWFTNANTTAPDAPTSVVTSTSTNGNGWRTIVPTYNSSYPYYFYCWQYQYEDGTYDWSAVVYDRATSESEERARTGVANAATADGKAVAAQNTANANIKSSVQLWFTKANSTAPSKPSGNNPITTSNASTRNAWNLVVPTYSSSYPYYFYCYQQQKGDGTYQWTDVVYDEATSTAMKKAQEALPSSTFTTFEQSTFKEVADEVDEQSTKITTLTTITENNGLTETTNISNTVNTVSQTASGNSTKLANLTTTIGANADGTNPSTNSVLFRTSALEQDLDGFKSTVTSNYATNTSLNAEIALRKGTYATCPTAADAAAKVATITPAVTGYTLYAGATVTVRFQYGNTAANLTLNVNSTGAKEVVVNGTADPLAKHVKWGAYATCTFVYDGTYWRFAGSDQEVVRVSTSETAIEQNAAEILLRATKEEASQMAQPNLTPYFLMPMTTTTDGYWRNLGFARFTQLEDGWAHFECDNTGTSTLNTYIAPRAISTLKAGEIYTLLVEFRNASINKAGGSFYTVQQNDAQVWGTDAYGGMSISNASIMALDGGTGSFWKSLTLLTEDSKDITGTVRGTLPKTSFMYINQQTAASQSISYDIRISLYEGEYAGPYKPYVGSQLYASQAELKVANDAISSKVSTNDYNGNTITSMINQDATTIQIAASKVQIDGTAVFNAIKSSADAAYDANGAAATVQNNLDNLQIGGRNLLLGEPTIFNQTNYKTYQIPTTIALNELSEGDKLTIQFWGVNADANSSGIGPFWGGGSIRLSTNAMPDENGYWVATYTVTAAHLANANSANKFIEIYNMVSGHSGMSLSIDRWKIERGDKATDWTPAPEDQTLYVDNSIADISIGGRNLLTDSADISKCFDHINKVTSIVGGHADPDGGANAYLITPNATTWYAGPASSRLLLTRLSVSYTFSIWLRADNATQCNLCCRYMDATPYSSTAHRKTVDVTTEWQRFYISAPLKQAQTVDSIWIGQVTTEPIYAFHPMVEMSSTPSDWSPAPEDQEAAINSARTWYAECPTAAATAAKVATITPATTAFKLEKGVSVSVKFTYANTVASPTLDVNDTGPKAIMRYGTTAPSTSAATSWQANSVNTLTYDGTNWRLNNWLNDNTTYNLGRNLHATAIKVLEAVASGLLMVGTASGYKKIAAGITFSLGYPILYSSAAYTANTTYTNTYETWNSVTYSSTAAIQSGAANKTIYLKGSISGNTFTIDSSNVFTTVVPTSEDNSFYIPLGVMSSATVGNFATSSILYAYVDGKFRQATPTEIVATHRVYYRTATADSSLDAPTSWVAEATGNVYDAWTTKVPPLAASTSEGQTKYFYLYTCEQRKRLDGTVECTKVLLDENTTVIDGGTIVTNTVTANQIAASTITGEEIAANTIDGNNIKGSSITAEHLSAAFSLDLGRVEGLNERLDSIEGGISGLQDNTQWVHYDETAGTIFGESGSANNVTVTGSGIDFNTDEGRAAWATGGVFHANEMEADTVDTRTVVMGDWALVHDGTTFYIDYIGS